MTPEDPFTAPAPWVAVASVEHAVHQTNESFTDAGLRDVDWTDAAVLLRRLRAARSDLHRLESALEVLISKGWWKEHITRPVAVDGAGVVDVWRGRKRSNWQHEALARAVIDANMAERGGEAPDPYEVRDWLLAGVGVNYWRVTYLREQGIDPDDYCLSEKGVPTVRIT